MKITTEKNQEKKSGVYVITNTINNKVYIGSTISGFKKRIKEHLYELIKNRHHSDHLQKAYNKYGGDSFEFSVLEICDKEIIIVREQFYLDKYKSYQRKNGYNILEKAYNSQGYKHTEETLKLIGEISKKRGVNPISIEAKRQANLGSKKDEAHSLLMSKIHSKKVIQLDLQGNFVKEWDSMTQAVHSFGLHRTNTSNISKCCNGKCKSYLGFMWVRKDDYKEDQVYSYNPKFNGKII